MYFEDLKKEGNKHFTEGRHEQALGVYFKALKYCQKFNMPEEMALVRSNCALACLKLQLYSDAYSHCCECVKMDPKMHKVCVCVCTCTLVHVQVSCIHVFSCSACNTHVHKYM